MLEEQIQGKTLRFTSLLLKGMIKDRRTARWKGCIGRGVWEGVELPCVSGYTAPPEPPHVRQPGSLHPLLLGFLQRPHLVGLIRHWSDPFPVPPLAGE